MLRSRKSLCIEPNIYAVFAFRDTDTNICESFMPLRGRRGLMPRAALRLTFPEGLWVGAVSRAHPAATLRVLAATPTDATGVALVEVTGPEPEVVVDAIREEDAVTDLTVLARQPEEILIQFETTFPLVLDAARESGVPIALPLAIQDGAARWEVTTSRDRLSDLGAQLETFGLSFTVESIYQEVDSEELLTEDQWEAIRTAVELGYYDVPRSCTQYEVAQALEIARSTCSETLHRAESRLITGVVSQEMDGE